MVPYPHRKKHLVVLGGPSEEPHAPCPPLYFQRAARMWQRCTVAPTSDGPLQLPSPFPAGTWTLRAFSPIFANKTSPVKPLSVWCVPLPEALGECLSVGQGDTGSVRRGLSSAVMGNLQGQRITESRGGLGWKGPSETI